MKSQRKCGEEKLKEATLNALDLNSTEATLCHSCHNTLKQKKLPSLSLANGLELDEIPENMRNMTDLESQIMAYFIFQFVNQLLDGLQRALVVASWCWHAST